MERDWQTLEPMRFPKRPMCLFFKNVTIFANGLLYGCKKSFKWYIALCGFVAIEREVESSLNLFGTTKRRSKECKCEEVRSCEPNVDADNRFRKC